MNKNQIIIIKWLMGLIIICFQIDWILQLINLNINFIALYHAFSGIDRLSTFTLFIIFSIFYLLFPVKFIINTLSALILTLIKPYKKNNLFLALEKSTNSMSKLYLMFAIPSITILFFIFIIWR